MAELGGTNVIGGASVSIEGNTDKLRQALAEARREAEAFERKPIRVPIEVDVRRVVSDFQRLTAELQKSVRPITIPVQLGQPGGGGGGSGGGGGGGGSGSFFNQFNQQNNQLNQANFSSTSNRLAFSSRNFNTVNNVVNNAPGPGGDNTPGLRGGGRGLLSAYGIAHLATAAVEAGTGALDYAHYAGTGNLAAQVKGIERTTQQIQSIPVAGGLGGGLAELLDLPGIDQWQYGFPSGKGRRTQRHEIEDMMEEDARRNARMDVVQQRLERSRSFGERAASATRDLATEAAEVGMTPAQRALAGHRNEVTDFERAAELTRQFTARGDTDEVKAERAALGGKDVRLAQNVQREAETQMATHQQRMRDIALAGEEGRAAAEGRVRQAELIALKRDLAAKQAVLEAAIRARNALPANATPEARRAADDAVAAARGGVTNAGQAGANAAAAQGRDIGNAVFSFRAQAAVSGLSTARNSRAAALVEYDARAALSIRQMQQTGRTEAEIIAAQQASSAGRGEILARMREESGEFFQSMTGRREVAALVGAGRGHSAGIIADAYAGAREIREAEPSRQAEVTATVQAEMGATRQQVLREASAAKATAFDPKFDVIGAPTAREGVNEVLKSFGRAGDIINGAPGAGQDNPQVQDDIKKATEAAAEALKTLVGIFSQGFAPQLP